MCEALTFLFDNIDVRFGSKLYPQIVGISTGTSFAPLVAYLFLFSYERALMMCFQMMNNLKLLKLSTLLFGIWTTY